MTQSDSTNEEKNKREKNLVGGIDYTTEQLLNGMNGITEIYSRNSEEKEMEDESENETPAK